MIGVNKVILIGNLGKDPDIITFPQDNREDTNVVKKATFTLATTEVHRNREGEKIEQTDWHNIVCWRGLADIAERILKKGMQVYVEGKLQNRSWEDHDGNRRSITEVVADNFTVLGGRPRNDYQYSNQHQDPYDTILNEATEPLSGLPF